MPTSSSISIARASQGIGLENNPQFAVCYRFPGHVTPPDPHRSGILFFQTGNDPQQCCFTAPARTQHGHELPLLDTDADVAQRRELAEHFGNLTRFQEILVIVIFASLIHFDLS
jgi:hypothetical protein